MTAHIEVLQGMLDHYGDNPLHFTLEKASLRAAIAALRAQPSEPQGVAVAWILPTGHGTGLHIGSSPPVEGVGWQPLVRPTAPAGNAGGDQIGWLNVSSKTFYTLAELAASPRNDQLIEAGRIIRVYGDVGPDPWANCRPTPQPDEPVAVDDPAKAALMAESDRSMGIGFDKWFENPYTQVVLKSIAEDYVPRPAAPVAQSREVE